MNENTDNHAPKHLIPYLWKKGVSANPKGRPKGKTLKEFAREYLMSLPDDEKVAYLSSLPTEITWKMAEGMPQSNSDVNLKGDLSISIAEAVHKKYANTPPSSTEPSSK